MLESATVAQASFYDIGGHLMYFSMITAHFCLFIDESPLQKIPLCSVNFVLSVLASAATSAFVVEYFTFASFTAEILTGLAVALLTSIIFALSFQRILNVQWNFSG